jgi:hypothetical protein
VDVSHRLPVEVDRACGTGLSTEGNVPTGNFNGNPVATFFGEKRLTG